MTKNLRVRKKLWILESLTNFQPTDSNLTATHWSVLLQQKEKKSRKLKIKSTSREMICTKNSGTNNTYLMKITWILTNSVTQKKK